MHVSGSIFFIHEHHFTSTNTNCYKQVLCIFLSYVFPFQIMESTTKDNGHSTWSDHGWNFCLQKTNLPIHARKVVLATIHIPQQAQRFIGSIAQMQ